MFIQKPGHVADAATVMLLSDGNNVNFNHNSLDTITSDKVGTYRVRKNRYHTNVYPYIFLCEIESVPTEILVPGQTTEFMVDDDCMLNIDTSGYHCKPCATCLNGYQQEYVFDTEPIAWTSSSPSQCAYTLTEDCDGLICEFSQVDNRFTIRIDDQTELRDYNITFTLSAGSASIAFT